MTTGNMYLTLVLDSIILALANKEKLLLKSPSFRATRNAVLPVKLQKKTGNLVSIAFICILLQQSKKKNLCGMGSSVCSLPKLNLVITFHLSDCCHILKTWPWDIE